MENREEYLKKINSIALTEFIDNLPKYFKEILHKDFKIEQYTLDKVQYFKLREEIRNYLAKNPIQLTKKEEEENKKDDEEAAKKFEDQLVANSDANFIGSLGGAINKTKDIRLIIDFKKIYKELNQQIYYETNNTVSSIVKDGISQNNEYKLFLGGADTNIYTLGPTNDLIIKYALYGAINYQCMKFMFLISKPVYRNKQKMEDDVKNNKDEMAKYIKWIYTNYNFPQMKKFIGSTASLFNYESADINNYDPANNNNTALFSFYLLKDFFKRNNNEYIREDLYKEVEYKPLSNKKQIPLRLLQASAKPDIHYDKMIADRYTNSSKSFTPNDLTNLLGMMNFQEKLKNQVGGGQYGGSHLYEHIFENLQNKLAGYKIKINHNDEEEISKYIKDLANNEKKIIDSLDTIKKFSYSKNIDDYKGYVVSVDDMYNEIIKTRKDSADKEDKLMGFITKLNKWIKEHFNE